MRTASWIAACAASVALALPRTAPQAQAEGEAPRVVRASAGQLEQAGVRFARAEPRTIERALEVLASVVVPEGASRHVNPRLPGMLREVHVKPGDEVRRGDPLCVVESFALGEAVHGYLRLRALVEAHEGALPRRREMLERGVEFAAQALARGRELAELELNTWRELRELESALRDREFARDDALFEFETLLGDQRIELEAAAEHLKLLGVEGERLSHDEDDRYSMEAHSGRYSIRAPADGVIVARDAMAGEHVDERHALFELRDLSSAWVTALVHERELAGVARGAPARVRVAAFPGHVFEGRVSFVGFELDPGSRAAAVRIEVENAPIAAWGEPWPLRPGMSGRASIELARTRAERALPAAAVWSEGGVEHVFVRGAEGLVETRRVTLGARSPATVELLGGIGPDEEVAVEGLFFLKSMLRRGGE